MCLTSLSDGTRPGPSLRIEMVREEREIMRGVQLTMQWRCWQAGAAGKGRGSSWLVEEGRRLGKCADNDIMKFTVLLHNMSKVAAGQSWGEAPGECVRVCGCMVGDVGCGCDECVMHS